MQKQDAGMPAIMPAVAAAIMGHVPTAARGQVAPVLAINTGPIFGDDGTHGLRSFNSALCGCENSRGRGIN